MRRPVKRIQRGEEPSVIAPAVSQPVLSVNDDLTTLKIIERVRAGRRPGNDIVLLGVEV
jgi:hypothetical protein